MVMDESYLVFTGRPNAGKSSVIRSITGLRAPSGKRPGTTRRIETYPLSKGLVLVDMPGYGRITGVSSRVESELKDRMLGFLEDDGPRIALAVHVIDVSTFMEVSLRLEDKGIIPIDIEMIEFLLDSTGEPPLVAVNKIDKVGGRELDECLVELGEQLGPESDGLLFPVSSRTGEGMGSLKAAIHARLSERGFRAPFGR